MTKTDVRRVRALSVAVLRLHYALSLARIGLESGCLIGDEIEPGGATFGEEIRRIERLACNKSVTAVVKKALDCDKRSVSKKK